MKAWLVPSPGKLRTGPAGIREPVVAAYTPVTPPLQAEPLGGVTLNSIVSLMNVQDTIHDLTSAHWWITVAIASLILNVLASYMRGGLDRILPKLSARFGSWTELKTKEFQDDIDLTSGDLQRMTFLAARQASCHVAALHSYFMGAVFFYVSHKLTTVGWLSTVLLLVGVVFTVAGSREFGYAMRCKTILDGVRKKNKKG